MTTENERKPDLIERTMKVAEEAYSAGNLVTCDGYYEFDLDAASAIIASAIDEAVAAERAGKIDEFRDLLADAYAAGATDVHNWWAAGNTEGEADFGEAASDYAANVDQGRLSEAAIIKLQSRK